ncbi:MAG TPA: long-chain-fatty-acid--CoA ligase [bacterium]|nr:long-chain-fatty-acid--CoA ligase [bacterium]
MSESALGPRGPLSPLQFFRRAADVYGSRTAVVDGAARLTYREFAARCARLAEGLRTVGLRPGDRVAVLALNSHRTLECYYSVPLAGGVLVPLNTRLRVDDYRYILSHAGVRLLLVDPALADSARAISGAIEDRVVVLHDRPLDGASWPFSEQLIASASPSDLAPILDRADDVDEDAPITINYTSGTTAHPKGVILTHRIAALNALDVVIHGRVTMDDVYLHTLPMFHVNGWGGVWAITAVGATHVCVPRVEPAQIVELIDAHGVTVACAAPTVLVMLGGDASTAGWRPRQPVRWYVGGAPPPAALIRRMEEELGFEIIHVYGLTETGPWLTVCEWRREWDELPVERRAALKARQGVPQILTGRVRVVRPDLSDVDRDGVDVGEIVVRGPTVTPGYYEDAAASRTAWAGGWFHTGDLAVVHPDGYLQIVDRQKDLIVSGGENISSVEVESALYQHPAVLEVAVVAVADAYWGEVPKAVVVLRSGAHATGDDLIAFARERLARFKAPKLLEIVDALPKTATGKIQKYVLRAAARASHDTPPAARS